jgi:hypothetical protein
MGAFVAAAGILPVFAFPPSPEASPGSSVGGPAASAPNSRYAAELIRRGPFTEALPGYLEANGIKDANIGDTAALQALDAVQLVITANPDEDPFADGGGTQVYAHMETYDSVSATRTRAEGSLATAGKRYSLGIEAAKPESFCLSDPSFWLCGGYRGLVYAEVTLSPGPNANLPLARGTLAAMLRYADDRMRLATD